MAIQDNPGAIADPKQRAEALPPAHMSLFSPEGDFDRWSKLWTDDVVIEFPFAPEKGFPPRVEGIAAWTEMCRGIKEHLPDYRYVDMESHPTDDPDVIFAEWRGISKQAGYDQRYMVRFDLRDGKVWRYREYFNSEALVKGGMTSE